MPSYPHIERYRADLQRFLEFGGSDNEQSIRRAFAVCLDSYCRDHREKLALVDELDAGGGSRVTGTGIRPDGTVKDSLRMARGYWEAKDTHDDLDAEIQAKFNRGYPRDNILFEDSATAVLFQNGNEAMRVDMSRPGELHRLIRRFLDYELPEIGEFRQARQQFKTDLPAVLESLREAVADAEANNPDYQDAAAVFLTVCRQTISPDVSDGDVREMLLQHILTKDIFLRVFAEDQFHRENNVARQLDALERTFFTGDVRRQAIDRLRAYYGAIGRAADEIADHDEKQRFLKGIYEDFYQAYNPAAADRLGVVYTPNEVVDFIIRGTDHLLQKHFGRTLADDNVQILDPATGTGTFITSLINHLPLDRLEYKYRNEIHANEVAILPYYIANLNIEYTYRERTGRYLEFPNLCFVDTLDNMDWQGASGGAVTRQGAFNLGGMSEENWIRVQEQNEKSISVIIGNPPYNANQQNETTTTRTANIPPSTGASARPTSPPAPPRRPSSTTCTSGSSAGLQTGWPTMASLVSSPTAPIWKRGRTMASGRWQRGNSRIYTSLIWAPTCAVTPKSPAPRITCLAFRPESQSASSCASKPGLASATSITLGARMPSSPRRSWPICATLHWTTSSSKVSFPMPSPIGWTNPTAGFEQLLPLGEPGDQIRQDGFASTSKLCLTCIRLGCCYESRRMGVRLRLRIMRADKVSAVLQGLITRIEVEFAVDNRRCQTVDDCVDRDQSNGPPSTSSEQHLVSPRCPEFVF